MSFNLIDLNYGSKPKDCCYFFDSNILLPVLGLPHRDEFEKYLTFFNAVYGHCLENPVLKIYTCSNQLSEVFNILMNLEMKKVYNEQEKIRYPDVKKFYKDIFRPSENYTQKFDLFKNEFLTYADVFELVDPGSKMNLAELLDFDVRQLDFNDQVILQCVKSTGSILVSDDKDFYGTDITQATFNGSLIKRFRDQPIKVAAAKS